MFNGKYKCCFKRMYRNVVNYLKMSIMFFNIYYIYNELFSHKLFHKTDFGDEFSF